MILTDDTIKGLWMTKRPSHSELSRKIKDAIGIVAAGGKFLFANDAASMAEIRAERFNIDDD